MARASETLARRLESTAEEWSDDEHRVVVGDLPTAYGMCREDDALDISTENLADVERLMQGVREEVQKLDEGLRMLSAYVARLRRRTAAGVSETLH